MEIRDERAASARCLDALDADPDGGAARLLQPAATLYALGARWLRRLRPDRALPAPPFTIGVGNARVGGTGKTPLTADLGRRLAAAGHRVAVVTRGYRAREDQDEPGWLKAKLGVPVFVEASRERGLERARRSGADLVLLDDALQTRFRPRSCLAIVLEGDLGRPPRVLPAGPARESPAAALARAQAWIVRLEGPGNLAARVEALRPLARARGLGERPFLGARLTPVGLRPADAGQLWPLERGVELGPTLLVSGLARPASFERDARSAGVDAVASLRWDDHCDPGPRQAESLARWARESGARTLLCPEKNLGRVVALDPPLPCFSLVSELEWSVEDPLRDLAPLLPPR